MKKEVRAIEFVETVQGTEGATPTRMLMVSIGRDEKQFATLYKEDYDRLIELGAYKRWQLIKDKYVRCATRNGQGHVMIARALVNCPPGYCVVYLDGNPLNLRRENLGIRKGQGKHDARGLMYQSKEEAKVRRLKNVIPAVEMGVFDV